MEETEVTYTAEWRGETVTCTDDDIAYWFFDGVCEAIDGCTVEPDGRCSHGAPSWLLYLGII